MDIGNSDSGNTSTLVIVDTFKKHEIFIQIFMKSKNYKSGLKFQPSGIPKYGTFKHELRIKYIFS